MKPSPPSCPHGRSVTRNFSEAGDCPFGNECCSELENSYWRQDASRSAGVALNTASLFPLLNSWRLPFLILICIVSRLCPLALTSHRVLFFSFSGMHLPFPYLDFSILLKRSHGPPPTLNFFSLPPLYQTKHEDFPRFLIDHFARIRSVYVHCSRDAVLAHDFVLGRIGRRRLRVGRPRLEPLPFTDS